MKLLLLVITYLVASIPFSLILGKIIKGMDIREYGSGNVGSTNAARVLGKKIGLITLILDVLKGYIPVIIALNNYGMKFAIIVSLVAVIGHSYSIYLKFKGGKAVATSTGVMLALSPYSVVLLAIIFVIIVVVSSYVSLASISVALLLPFIVYLLNGSKDLIIFAYFLGLFIAYRHKSNIYNLINGKEDKFFDKANKL